MAASLFEVSETEQLTDNVGGDETDKYIMVDPVHPLFGEDTGLTVQNRKFCLATSNQGEVSYEITAHAFERFMERVDRETMRLFPSLNFEDKQDALWALHMLISIANPTVLQKEKRARDQRVLAYKGWYFVLRSHSEARIVTCLKCQTRR